MACKCQRYDAAHNPILPLPDMKLFYKNNPEALALLKRFMPYRYVVIPNIEIRILLSDKTIGLMYIIFPGRTNQIELDLKEKDLENLRRLYKRSKRWKHDDSQNGWMILRREGTIIEDPLHRFGIKRPSQ